MRKAILSLSGLCLLLTIAACNMCTKRLECPAYQGRFMYSWFPYNEVGKVIRFANSTGDIDSIVIANVTQSDAYVLTSSGRKPLDICEEVRGTITSVSDTGNPHLVYLELSETEEISRGEAYASRQFQFKLNSFRVFFKTYEGELTGINYNNAQAYQLEQMETGVVNGKTYDNVAIITITDSSTAAQQMIDKVYLGKGVGIIGYRTYPDTTTTYWLQ